MNRKTFIKRSVAGSAGLLFSTSYLKAQKNPLFELQEIKEFVFAAHKDLEATKKIIEAKPLLLNCTNQSKKGDFETAVGGASHMGRRDIADLLVSKGARLDIFNYTFLGYSDFVKQLITDYPDLINSPGPHGFTLLHHAKVGGHTEMMEWLQEKGLKEMFFKGSFG